MKITTIKVISFLMLIITINFIGCTKVPESKSSTCTDPPGTVTSNISNKGKIDFHTGAIGDANAFCYGVSSSITMSLYFDPFNFSMCKTGVNIADVGQVSCLGEVATIPSSGFVVSLATTLGHGYVLRLTDGTFARIYCEKWVTSTSGGVTGIIIKWQYPF